MTSKAEEVLNTTSDLVVILITTVIGVIFAELARGR